MTENQATAKGNNLSVSQKHCREIGEFIKGDTVEKAKGKLEKVINKDLAVPYDRYNSDQAHRSGNMDAGRYPVNASKEVLNLLKSAEHNAIDQGMDPDSLFISAFFATEGNKFLTPKRNRGRRPKRAHITVRLQER